ncbi:hypothetical protein B0H66DRAFT_475599 [Apodospora peruviana]|uniref:Uncharacterized protein n=1 Tax=Apodospora peruviana TaxID=516989 RepID=A0AAE0I5Q9_9PEZI|nr:hypothetical protein B0H66DRAFT_475599 [Apodospora peruviana]
MVGFAVIAPAFDLSNQNPRTFRTMSLILTVSRFTLATQYGSILWHVRRYKTTHVPLGLMAGMNLASSIIYLGVAFGFKESGTTSLWVVWFIITGIETILSVAFSLKWKVLGFQGTHLTTRMSLLTFILMGEGIITICSAVTKIVLNANSWTSATTGNVTAGIGTIYVIFMIYFDWRRHLHLPRIKQLAWSFMHFPFHLALKLFIACSSQFVIWWKVFEVLYNTTAEFEAAFASVADPNFNVTTEWFVNALESTIGKVFDVYPPKFQDTITAISDSLGTLAEIPADFWEGAYPEDDPIYGQLMNVTETLSLAVENSLFATFNINGFSSFTSFNGTEDELQRKVEGQNFSKFNTVFTYAFIAAGCTLILLNILFIISRTRNWTPFNYVRKGINFLAGIGLCLISIVVRTPVTEESDQSKMFAYTPWPLPTLLLVFFCILIINHLPHPPPFFFGSKAVPSDNAGGVQEWENIKVSGDASSAENKTAYQRVHVRGEDVEAGHHGHSH